MADCKKKMDQELAVLGNLTKESPKDVYTSNRKHIDIHTNDITSTARNLNIFIISAVALNTLVRQAGKARDIEIFNVSMRNIEITLQLKKSTNPAIKPPAKFHNYLAVFSKIDLDLLQDH